MGDETARGDESSSRPGRVDGKTRLRVAVLSCSSIGRQVALRLVELQEVSDVLLLTAPYTRRSPSLLGRLRRSWKMDGPADTIRAAVRRLLPGSRTTMDEFEGRDGLDLEDQLPEGIRHRHVADLHSAESIEFLRRGRVDLGVVAGTYILEPSVFRLPRLGSINLHSGKAPEYRGAAPAFWELYEGESEIGITIHEVEEDVDAGRILAQELFPLNPAPDGDPLEYIERVRDEVLRPNGIRMLADVTQGIARGTIDPVDQDPSSARVFRTPDYRAKRELKRRVAARRASDQ